MLKVVQGDITKVKVDVIVNAANRMLLGGGGVDGAIHRVAGPELLEECRGLGGCNTGEAKITKGYDLPAKWVVHTVGPIYAGGRDGEALFLAKCYRGSLELANEKGAKSIAFPCISTGVYGYPQQEAAEIAVSTIIDYLSNSSTKVIDVFFVVFCDEDRDIYTKIFKELPSFIKE